MSSVARFEQDDWRALGACTGELASVFYPPLRPERKSSRISREARAKAVCATCVVRQECLAAAFANDERYGIWGGLTDRERRLAAPPGEH